MCRSSRRGGGPATRNRRRPGGSTNPGRSIPGTARAAPSPRPASRRAARSAGPAQQRTGRHNRAEVRRAARTRSAPQPGQPSVAGNGQLAGAEAGDHRTDTTHLRNGDHSHRGARAEVRTNSGTRLSWLISASPGDRITGTVTCHQVLSPRCPGAQPDSHDRSIAPHHGGHPQPEHPDQPGPSTH